MHHCGIHTSRRRRRGRRAIAWPLSWLIFWRRSRSGLDLGASRILRFRLHWTRLAARSWGRGKPRRVRDRAVGDDARPIAAVSRYADVVLFAALIGAYFSEGLNATTGGGGKRGGRNRRVEALIGFHIRCQMTSMIQPPTPSSSAAALRARRPRMPCGSMFATWCCSSRDVYGDMACRTGRQTRRGMRRG